MKIKKGDTILVIQGKDAGKVAKVLKAFPKEGRVLAEGIHMVSRHVRPRRQGEQGQVVKVAAPFNVSNVKFVCPKCNKAVRLGYKITGNKKMRLCKKCNSEF